MKSPLQEVRRVIAELPEPFEVDDVAAKLDAASETERKSVRSSVFYLADRGELDKEEGRSTKQRGTGQVLARVSLFRRTDAFLAEAAEPAVPGEQIRARAEGLALLQSVARNWTIRRQAARAEEHGAE